MSPPLPPEQMGCVSPSSPLDMFIINMCCEGRWFVSAGRVGRRRLHKGVSMVMQGLCGPVLLQARHN